MLIDLFNEYPDLDQYQAEQKECCQPDQKHNQHVISFLSA